ncbi:MAG TPA: hypothetical protein VGB45_16125 [Abditibacterium sp.]|jgi:hypothetical protein
MQQQLLNAENSVSEENFVNFYTLLGVDPATPAEEMQDAINALYQDAQINRDHRVPTRRREYQYLLEILPQARAILLDAKRRKRYDAYCHAVKMDAPRLPYAEFVRDLMREKDANDGRTDILTLRDLSRLHLVSDPASPAPVAIAPAIAESATSKAATSASTSTPAPSPTTPSNAPFSLTAAPKFSASSFIGGAVVLTGLLALLPSLTKLSLEIASPLALVGAVVTAYVFSLADEGLSV